MLEIGPIVLRAWEKEDLEKIHRWENDFSIMLYSNTRPENMVSFENLEDRYNEERKNEKSLNYIVELKDENVAIGTATIRIEDWGKVRMGDIGTYIEKKYWNQGLGKIITLALLELSFHFLNLDKCVAYSAEFNIRAHKVLEACGFKRSGVHRKSGFVLGRRIDWYFFDILKEEYLQMREDLIRKYLGDAAEDYLKKVTLS